MSLASRTAAGLTTFFLRAHVRYHPPTDVSHEPEKRLFGELETEFAPEVERLAALATPWPRRRSRSGRDRRVTTKVCWTSAPSAIGRPPVASQRPMVIHPYETLDSMRVHMTFERETKNTVRFAEDENNQPDEHPGTPALVTVYIQKVAWQRLGKPRHIAIQLSAR